MSKSNRVQSESSSDYLLRSFDRHLQMAASRRSDFMDDLAAIEIAAADLEVDHPLRKIDFYHLLKGRIISPTETLHRHFRDGNIDADVIDADFGETHAEYRPTFPASRLRKQKSQIKSPLKGSTKKIAKQSGIRIGGFGEGNGAKPTDVAKGSHVEMIEGQPSVFNEPLEEDSDSSSAVNKSRKKLKKLSEFNVIVDPTASSPSEDEWESDDGLAKERKLKAERALEAVSRKSEQLKRQIAGQKKEFDALFKRYSETCDINKQLRKELSESNERGSLLNQHDGSYEPSQAPREQESKANNDSLVPPIVNGPPSENSNQSRENSNQSGDPPLSAQLPNQATNQLGVQSPAPPSSIAKSPVAFPQVLIASNPNSKYSGWIKKGTVELSTDLMAATLTDAKLAADLAIQHNLHVSMSTVVGVEWHAPIREWIGYRLRAYQTKVSEGKLDTNGELLHEALQRLEVQAKIEDPSLLAGTVAAGWRNQLFRGFLSTRAPIFWDIFKYFLAQNDGSEGQSLIHAIIDCVQAYTPEHGVMEQNSLAIAIRKLCHERGISSLDENPTADLTQEQEGHLFTAVKARLNKVAVYKDNGKSHPSATYAEILRGQLEKVDWATYNDGQILLPVDMAGRTTKFPTLAQLCAFLGEASYTAYHSVKSLANAGNAACSAMLQTRRESLTVQLHQLQTSPAAAKRPFSADGASLGKKSGLPQTNANPSPFLQGPRSAKRKTIGGIPPTPSKKTNRPFQQKCPRCGRRCEKSASCMFDSHPDANDSTTVNWEGSRAQKAWAAIRDNQGVPYRSIQHGYTALKVPGQLISIVSVHTLTSSHTIDLSHLFSTLSNSEPPRIRARSDRYLVEDVAVLLDTGATSHNFIDEYLVDKLCVPKMNLVRSIHVTSIHNTTTVSNYVKMAFLIHDSKHKGARVRLSPTTIFLVLHNSPLPLIIGLRTIKSYKLTRVFDDYFTTVPAHSSELLFAQAGPVTSPEISHPGHTWRFDTSLRTVQPDAVCEALEEGEEDAFPQNPRAATIDRVSELTRAGKMYVVQPQEHFFGSRPESKREDEHLQEPRHTQWDEAFSKNVPPEQHEADPASVADAVSVEFNVFGTPEEKGKLLALLEEFQDVFCTELPSQSCDCDPIHIEVDMEAWNSDTRNKGRYRYQGTLKDKIISDYVQQGLEKRLLVRAPSGLGGWSQVVMVPKKTPNDWRTCIDYGVLNDCTKTSLWPIPAISELLRLAATHQPRRFATLDLTSGFHQMALTPETIALTAFICWCGVFCYTRAPMGPKHIPGLFQRNMEFMFAGLIFVILLIYIDDLLTWGTDSRNNLPIDPIDDLIINLRAIFVRAREKGVKFNPMKSKFGLKEIEYVGHLIDAHGLTFSQEKLAHLADFDFPVNKGLLKTFLGLAGYFREHVYGYVHIVQPLQEAAVPYTKKNKKDLIEWTPALQESFESLKKSIVECIKIAHRRDGTQLRVFTDASDYGYGLYICQVYTAIDDNGNSEEREECLAVASRSFNASQRKWHTYDKEGFGTYFPFVQYELLLRESFFTLFTDHRNLTFLTSDSNPRVQRWRMYMQEFEFAIAYIKGETNVVADAFSRLCSERPEEEPTTLHALRASNIDTQIDNEQFARSALFDATASETDGSFMGSIHDMEDPYLGTRSVPLDQSTPMYWFNSSDINADQLISEIYLEHTPELCLPLATYEMAQWKRDIIGKCHNALAGHWGVQRTLTLLDDLLAREPQLLEGHPEWLNKRQDVKHIINHCPICQKTRHYRLLTQTRPYSTSTYGIMENLSIDGVKMTIPSPQGHIWVITIIDSFSRFVQVYPTKDCSSETAVECLIQWMGTFGVPSHIRTDNSSQFEGKYAEILRLLNIQRLNIQAYSHQENGIVEVAHRELLRHLTALLMETKALQNWHVVMYIAQRILNARVVKATGVAPQDLVFAGRLDLNRGILFPRQVRESESISEYLRTSMEMQESMLQKAIEQQRETDLAHLAKGSHILPPIFPLNVYVAVAREVPDKMKPTWLGPYLIVHREPRLEGDIYTCRNTATGKDQDFRVERLRIWDHDENDVTPDEVVHMDQQAFIVEAVLDHRFNGHKTAANLQLLIKWLGYEDPEWQTYETSTRKLGLVHDYLRQHRLARFIPSVFKS